MVIYQYLKHPKQIPTVASHIWLWYLAKMENAVRKEVLYDS